MRELGVVRRRLRRLDVGPLVGGVLDDDELTRVLDRMVRLADAVQIVVVTDREAAVAWAAQIGSEKALVHSA